MKFVRSFHSVALGLLVHEVFLFCIARHSCMTYVNKPSDEILCWHGTYVLMIMSGFPFPLRVNIVHRPNSSLVMFASRDVMRGPAMIPCPLGMNSHRIVSLTLLKCDFACFHIVLVFERRRSRTATRFMFVPCNYFSIYTSPDDE